MGHTSELHSLLDDFRRGDADARCRVIECATDRLRKLTRRMLRGYPKVRRWAETDDVLNAALLRRGVPCAQCGATITLDGSPGAAPAEPPRETSRRPPGYGAPPPIDASPKAEPPPIPASDAGGVQPCGSCSKLFDSTAKVCPFCGQARTFAGSLSPM